MKIAVSAIEPHLESDLEPRFGRSSCFLLVEPETMQFETLMNPNTEQPSGAGIGTAEFICRRGVSVVITGTIGPKAYRVLSAAGIRMLTGLEGKVSDAIQRYKECGLVDQRYPEDSAGKMRGRAIGGGGGMGRGMRCGQGKGMGLGAGRGGRARYRGRKTSPRKDLGAIESNGRDELALLKKQADTPAGELDDTQRPIREIESR